MPIKILAQNGSNILLEMFAALTDSCRLCRSAYHFGGPLRAGKSPAERERDKDAKK